MSNKKRRCTHCKEYSIVEDGALVPAGFFCSMPHVMEYANCKRDKQRAKQITKAKQAQVELSKAGRKAAKELKQNDKRHQFKLTKSKIQQWVNHVRDAGLPCISCGNTKTTIQYCGGHYKTAGGFPELALNTLNIHKQCNRYCNMNLSGNLTGNKHSEGYTEGLIKRYGEKRVDLLNSRHVNPNYGCEQLISIRAFYSKLIRESNPDDSERPFN